MLAAVAVLLWGLAMRRGLNHDEHQFVASGALIARNGLLPYRDFPYFHVPTLSLLNAWLFHGTDYLLLAARTLSIAAGWLTLALLLVAALIWLRNLSLWQRLLVGAAAIALLMASPSFIHASGRAWNHDLPILCTVAAALLQTAWLAHPRRTPAWLAGAGLLMGLAAGLRLTFVLVAVPFALSIFFTAAWRSRRRWLAVLAFAAGMVCGLLPTLAFFVMAPDRFIFGNLTYAGLNTAYYRQLAQPVAGMTLLQKLQVTVDTLLFEPGNLLLVMLAAGEVWRVRRYLHPARSPSLLFLLAALPFLAAGAWAPTPIQIQYLYLFLPWLVLILLAALGLDRRPRLGVWVITGAAVLAALLAAPRYIDGLQTAFVPAEWFPLKVHARGEVVAQLSAGADVLTLAPTYPLEGKAGIYPEFVTGPLAWRVAPLMSAAERTRTGVVALDELGPDLAARPPRAILTGLNDSDAVEEQPLVDFARQQGYVPVALPEAGALWMAPVARWNNQISLGAAQLPRVPVAPGTPVVATFYLQATQPITRNLNVLVRLVGANGELLRDEGWPWGKPTSQWETGAVWADGHTLHLPADAADGPYRVEVSFYDPATLETLGDPATAGYVVVGKPSSQAQAPAARFGDGIMLDAAKAPESGWSAGATLPVELTWRGVGTAHGRYTIFVQLIGPDGALVAQHDQEPLQGLYPTSAWLPDIPITDKYELTLPATLPPGAYRLMTGLYDAKTMQRLPLLQDGQPAGDAFTVATVQVK